MNTNSIYLASYQIIQPFSKKKIILDNYRCFHLKSSNKLSHSIALLILLKVLQLHPVLIEFGKQKGIEWQLYNDLHFT